MKTIILLLLLTLISLCYGDGNCLRRCCEKYCTNNLKKYCSLECMRNICYPKCSKWNNLLIINKKKLLKIVKHLISLKFQEKL